LEAGLAPQWLATALSDSALTLQEIFWSVRRDKTLYTTLKYDKEYNLWSRGLVATAFMHHTHLVLDEKYMPPTVVVKILLMVIRRLMSTATLICCYWHAQHTIRAIQTSMKHKRNVYTMIVGDDNDIPIYDEVKEQYFRAFKVDNDISEVLAYESNMPQITVNQKSVYR
jgi:hypothetical protein